MQSSAAYRSAPATVLARLGHCHHGRVLGNRLDPEIENGRRARQALADAGISLQAHCERLLADGVKSFATAFDEMMAAIRERSVALLQRH